MRFVLVTVPGAQESQESPSFSIVSAVYDVERYLDEFIAAIEAQTYPSHLIQVVAVDDGSTDGGLERLRRWQRETDLDVVVVTKTNGGQGSARNAGLEHATSDWVTFTDPDDLLIPEYFERIATFLDENPDTAMVATHRIYLDEADGKLRDTHPLRWMFADGDVLRHLGAWSRWFAGSAPASLFRREVLEETRLRFDDRVQPNFEDGHFCCRYLLSAAEPTVGFLRSAVYQYRRRSDGTSTLQTSQRDPRRFTDVLKYGYLDVLRRGAEANGIAPRWLQNFVVYELSWYVSSAHHAGRGASEGLVADEFHRLMPQILSYIERDVIETFTSRQIQPLWRAVLLHGYEAQTWVQDHAVVTAFDRETGSARLSYFFTGPAPQEQLEIRGRLVEPRHAKIRDFTVNHRVLLHERIVWVPPRTLDVDVIVVGDRISEDPELILPHPRAHERAFVLRPWVDIEPGAELPGRGPIADLLAQADESGVVRRDDLVLEAE